MIVTFFINYGIALIILVEFIFISFESEFIFEEGWAGLFFLDSNTICVNNNIIAISNETNKSTNDSTFFVTINTGIKLIPSIILHIWRQIKIFSLIVLDLISVCGLLISPIEYLY
jgi:hypothetical protein